MQRRKSVTDFPSFSCLEGSLAPTSVLISLEKSQKGSEGSRHTCAVCAYQFGFASAKRLFSSEAPCAHGARAPSNLIDYLHEEQRKPARHKCVVCAFQAGREFALLLSAGAKSFPGKSGGVVPEQYLRPRRTRNSLKREKRRTTNALPPMDPDLARELGLRGEEFALTVEQELLKRCGSSSVPEHVAQTIGDGLGYDIKSYFEDGSVKLVEVKTTNNACERDFYFSPRELEVCKEKPSQYEVMRVYNFDLATRNGSLLRIPGRVLLRDYQFDSSEYRVRLKRR